MASALPTSVNEYGTPVSVLTCSACGRGFTVCPALGEDWREKWGDECLADYCSSYDLSRDVDIFFEPMSEAGLIVRGDT